MPFAPMTGAGSGIDLDAIIAIDVHTHAEVSAVTGRGSLSPELEDAANEYFGIHDRRRPTVGEMAAYYRERNMVAVVFTVDATTAMGVPPVPNDEIAEAARAHPDVLIPFASVDPHLGRAAVREVHRLVDEQRVRGFKFHPNVQAFHPNDRMAYPVYEAIAEHGLVALFHTGQTGIGAGAPGGAGIRLKYSNPMDVDDVAADFPGLPIVLAHPSFPWQDEALAVATHKPLVHIDLSGWSPKYFPDRLVRYANTLLADKVLFGSDFPMITPDRWLADFEALDIKPDVRPKILKHNAARLLGLKGS
jgi:predicted TIM-barrel fold metal-dependent hydrolase